MFRRSTRFSSSSGDYEKSNSIESVDKKRFNKRFLSDVLSSTEDAAKRQKKAQALVDHLSKLYGINSPKVRVTERPRASFRRGNVSGQVNGFYRHSAIPELDTIVVYNTTAKTNKPVSIKSFADTLLHEFTHHYDNRYLKIESRHTAGFYKRISSLKEGLSAKGIATQQILSDITMKPLRELTSPRLGNSVG